MIQNDPIDEPEENFPADPANFDFSSSSTESFLLFLQTFGISVAVTSYDCQRLIVLREMDKQLDTYLVPVVRPRGIAVTRDRLTVAAYTEILNYSRHDNLLEQLEPDTRQQADALYMPLNKHITGEINVHDIAWGDEGLWLVNSRFTCLCTLHPDLSFQPRWFPPFVDTPTGNGEGHLNGMAMQDGVPAYATCFGAFFGGEGWRDQSTLESGLLMDVQRDEIVLDGLWMPHSPRVYRDKVYLCNSGYGEVLCYDPLTRRSETILSLPGFSRAITFWGDYMLVCCSRIRSSNVRAKLPVAERLEQSYAGIYIVDMTDFSIIAYTRFDGDVSQLYDIAIVPDSRWPLIPSLQDEMLKDLFVY